MSSNQPPKAIKARDGFYFLDNDSNEVVAQITGQKQLPQAEVFKWRLILETRHCWFAQHNIPYIYLAVPNKHCVYSEFLPEHIQLSKNRPINQIAHEVKDSFVSFMYPLNELVLKKDKGSLYRKKDSHWTSLGSYQCYLALIEKVLEADISAHKIEEDEITFFEEQTDYSDLGVHFNDREDTLITAFIDDSNIKCAFDNGIPNTGNLQVWKNHKGHGLPRALVFRDSFGGSLIAFLAASFSEAVFVWQPNIDFKLVEEFKPDVVISQQVERFIVSAPVDLAEPSQLERQQAKIAQGQIAKSMPVFKKIVGEEGENSLLSEISETFVQRRLTELLTDLVTAFPNSLEVQANYILSLVRDNKLVEAKHHYVSLTKRRKDIPLLFHRIVRGRIENRQLAPASANV